MTTSLTEFVTLLGRAEKVFDGRQGAVEWMESPCEGLGGFRPLDIAILGGDPRTVLIELEAIEAHYEQHREGAE